MCKHALIDTWGMCMAMENGWVCIGAKLTLRVLRDNPLFAGVGNTCLSQIATLEWLNSRTCRLQNFVSAVKKIEKTSMRIP